MREAGQGWELSKDVALRRAQPWPDSREALEHESYPSVISLKQEHWHLVSQCQAVICASGQPGVSCSQGNSLEKGTFLVSSKSSEQPSLEIWVGYNIDLPVMSCCHLESARCLIEYAPLSFSLANGCWA